MPDAAQLWEAQPAPAAFNVQKRGAGEGMPQGLAVHRGVSGLAGLPLETSVALLGSCRSHPEAAATFLASHSSVTFC